MAQLVAHLLCKQGVRGSSPLGSTRSLADVFRTLLAPHMLVLHALAVLATLAALALGVWQYGAWQDGREAQVATLVDAAPKPLASVLTADQAFPGTAVGQPVRLSGRWLPRATVYVTDRDLGGRTGVWAVTPVAVCPTADATASTGSSACRTAPAMLVVRGWAASRQVAPAAPTGAVRVTGWLQPGEGSGISDPDPTDDVIPELRVADAIQHVHQDLYGGYVIARDLAPAGSGLAKVTPAASPSVTPFTSLRNLLYALEWWAFGGFAVYVWVRWCRDELAKTGAVPSTT
jgi:surfeit locus 1 family protein